MLFAWLIIFPLALAITATVQANIATVSPAIIVSVVTNVVCLHNSSRAQANQGWPLRLEGVVTFADSNRSLLVLQDAQGAVALHMDFQPTNVQPGQRILVESGSAAVFNPAFPEFPLKPSGGEWLPTLSAPTNQGNAYLARMHGFLIPLGTGDYSFWIASKGSSELWLSTNADATNLRRIAFVPDGKAANPNQWDKFPTQLSGPIHLDAGQPCLFDVMHEQRAGRDDTVSVAWQGPGIAQSVIDGRFLKPYSNLTTNGIIREFWNDYLLESVRPLTAGGTMDAELVVANPRIHVLGDSPLPNPMPIKIGAALSPEQNFRWAEVEGVAEFAAKDLNHLSLELVQDHARVELKLPADAKINLNELVGTRVRARGVCESVVDANGKRTAGIIWVASENELSEIGVDAGVFQKLKLVSIGDLDPSNPTLAPGRRIRIRGTILEKGDGRLVIQGTPRFCGYVSTNGTEWKSVAPPVDIQMHDFALGGLLASSFTSGKLTAARFDSVSGVDSSAQDVEIASAIPAGKTVAQGGGKFVVQGGGTGFGSSFERMHFFCEALTDRTEISARVTGLESSEAGSVAGIMMRDSNDPRASFVSLTLAGGGGAVFHFRQSQSERDEMAGLTSCPLPCWLKLTRSYPKVEIRTDKTFSANVGETVDLTGSLGWNGNRPVLLNARQLEPVMPGSLLASSNSSISSVEISDASPLIQVAQLVPERGEGLREGTGSIIVRGVVTFSGQAFGTNYFVLQDETAGMAIRLNNRLTRKKPGVGEFVEYEIKSQNGRWPFPPDPNRVQALGAGRMPEPLSLAAANTLARRGEYRWVECRGIVRAAASVEGIKLFAKTGELFVGVGEGTDAELARYVDTLVQIRGVLVYKNNQTALLVPSLASIEIIEPAPDDPFEIPTINIDGLKSFSRQTENSHRNKVSGVVTYKNDRLLVIQDDSGGVRLKTIAPADVSVGDSIEAVGFPDGQPGSMSLSQALARKIGKGSAPAAVPVSGDELYSGSYGAQIVRLAGELLGQKNEDGDQVLEFQSGQRIFRAELLDKTPRLKPMPVGSQVQVMGVSWPERIGTSFSSSDNGESVPASFGILLRTPEDAVILQLPPWWAWKHATIIIGSLAVVLAVAMLWIRYLRLKVARRTQELKVAMSKLERETEISATLAERNRLAGEIHDGLEQGLSAIMMQLDGLESNLGADPAGSARHLELARNMVRFSRTEVRHSLWDWKSPALASKDLGGALTDIAKQMSAGNETQVAVHVSGNALPLPTAIEHHLLRIAQEALNNALKYAAASAINIILEFNENKIRLEVRDNGRGFDSENVLDGSSGHFGLQNLRSRARQMGGSLKVASAPGNGTIIEAIIPMPKSGNAVQSQQSNGQ